MKWWQWFGVVIVSGSTVVAEVVSWSIPHLAFQLLPSWIVCAVLASLIPWPRSGWIALALGLGIDVFSPAPFGLWLVMLLLLVVVTEAVRTTWVKQASALSAFACLLCGMVAASIPLWLWAIAAERTTAIVPVILLVPWWHWPVIWLFASSMAAVLVRILPSPYERLV